MFDAIMKDFAWIGLLLLIGAFLRAKVKLFQKLYIPTAVIAGFVGLLLGPQVLGRFSPVCITWSEYVGQYATPLLAILFCVQFFGVKFDRRVLKRASAVWVIATIVIASQFLLAVPITTAYELPNGFAALPQSAFYGGHGIPGVLTGIWEGMGYWDTNEAFTIGTTFATIGLLYGVTRVYARQNKLATTTKEHADLGEVSVAACSFHGGIEKYYLAVFCRRSPVFARAPAF